VTAGIDAGYGFEGKLRIIAGERLKDLGKSLQNLDVENELLNRCGQTTFLPADCVQQHVNAPEKTAPCSTSPTSSRSTLTSLVSESTAAPAC